MEGTILVTGADGYVGGRLTLALARAGVKLKLVARQVVPLLTEAANTEVVTWPEPVTEAKLDALMRGVRAVVHLGGSNEFEAQADPEKAVRLNTLGTLQLVRAAEKARVERFLFLSSARVYGSSLNGTVTEQTLPRPQDIWATSMLGAEHHVLEANDRWALAGIVLRASSIVGAPTRSNSDGWALPANALCREAVSASKLTVRSSPGVQHDFVPLTDLCRAIIHLLDAPFDALGDGVFNLGTGVARSMRAYAELIADCCERDLEYRPAVDAPPASDPGAPGLDYRSDKLRNSGFELTASLEHEVSEMLAIGRRAFAA